MVDSNHRRHSQQIYSLSPLATREIPHINLCVSLAFGAGRRTRTPDLLITKRSWSIKNGPFGPFFSISAPNENWPELLVSTVSVCFFRVWVTVWVAVFASVHRWWALFSSTHIVICKNCAAIDKDYIPPPGHSAYAGKGPKVTKNVLL